MTSVKIGPYTIDVLITNAQDSAGFDHEKWGDFRGDKQCIRIHEAAHDQVALSILLHESIHGIEFLVGMNMPEEFVRPLAPLLLAFLEDNGVDLDPLRKIISDARSEA